MRTTLKVGLLSTSLVLGLNGFAAAGIIYNEDVDGDLGESTELGTLIDATSTIIGSLDGGESGGMDDGLDEFDEIRFTTSAPWTLYIDSVAFTGTSRLVVLLENSLGQGSTSLVVSGPGPVLFFGNPSQGAGTWGLEFVPFTNRGQVDYQATIVQEVPTPASFALLTPVGLAMLRRRRS